MCLLESMDEMGRKWVRNPVCPAGFEFRDSECKPHQEIGGGGICRTIILRRATVAAECLY